MSEQKSKEQIANEKAEQMQRDKKIQDLKVEIFDIMRQQEALSHQINAYQELKKKKTQELLELEKIKIPELKK